MEIKYSSNKLEKSVSSPNEIFKNYGTRAKKVKQRLEELKAAANLEILKTIPAAGCHELDGNRKGQFAVQISGNHRIVFIPDQSTIIKKENGQIDFSAITIIEILTIGEDYH